MNNSKNKQSGQAFVLTVLFLTALVGMAALVVDLGSWFRQHRQLQATADAAALAGAQEIPSSPGLANSLARAYADRNTSGLTGMTVTFSSEFESNDTIHVHVQKPAPGFFSKVFGVDSVNEGAKAVARTGGMAQAKYVAPIVVKNNHPMLADSGCPCFGESNMTTLPLGKENGGPREEAPGAFAFVNLDGTQGGTGPGQLEDWIIKGYQNYLGLGDYWSDPGAKYNSSSMRDALTQRINTVLLFPIYDKLTGNGSNAKYNVIGWAAFYVTGFDFNGSRGTISGYFTEIIWEGLQATTPGGGGPNFGARTVQLID